METPTTRNNGKFAPGNAGGPGRPKGRTFELSEAAKNAVTPEHVAAIMRRMTRSALEGNLAAARFVVERACGRAPEAPVDAAPIGVTLPKLVNAANCTTAIDRLVEAMCSGTLDRDVAKALADMVTARMKGIELNELEARLVEMEKTAKAMADGSFARQPDPRFE